MCVCVCVRVREHERELGRERERVCLCVYVRVCVCVCVSVAILAQGTNFLLSWDGILLYSFGCDSVSAVGNISQYLLYRYLCTLPRYH